MGTHPGTTTPRGVRRAAPALVAVLGASLVLALQPWSMGRADAMPRILVPAVGAYFGSWVAPRKGEDMQAAVLRIESQIGRELAIDHQYYRWDANLPTQQQNWDVASGRIPFVNWNAMRTNGSIVRWSAIADGSQDSVIGAQADRLKAFGSPMYLAFHHEPEDDPSFGTPSDFAAAFRHIVTVFRAHGVHNVGYVWTLMSWTFDPRSGRDPMDWYPGDAYVNFVGSDGYNWAPHKPGAPWESFATVFAPTVSFARAHSKRVMAVEYGVMEDPSIPGRKAQWFRDALDTVKGWPEVKALIYFDELKDGYPWVTDSSASSMDAYQEISNDPWLDPLAPHEAGPGGGPLQTPRGLPFGRTWLQTFRCTRLRC